MNVLGIETSCDETSAGVIRDGSNIRSLVISSSIRLHSRYGGIIPEIASRAQLEYIGIVVDEALKRARVPIKKIGLISVTKGPGLIGSLLVGISFAKALSFAKHIPLLGVDHVHAHVYAAFLNKKRGTQPKFPFIGLVVSGGHTSLFYFNNFASYTVLGETLDDAAGEAFDKVAKLLGLGYPGGPAVEKAARGGNIRAFQLTCTADRTYNFSFSGIKTAVVYAVRDIQKRGSLSKKHIRDITASFQHAVVSALVQKSIHAAAAKKSKTIVLGGGVAANRYLRLHLQREAEALGLRVHIPPVEFCTDNAAVVAGLGYHLYRLGKPDTLGLRPILY